MTASVDADWSNLLTGLVEGTDLSRTQALTVMTSLMEGQLSPALMAGFLIALRAKGETADEVSAAAEAMRNAALPLALPGVTVDVVGTGGDRSGTVNISTMAAVVVAACGAPVIKHGNRAASSKSGSADVLEQLGVPLALPPAAVESLVAEIGIGFAFAQVFHPAMRHAGPVRRELGVATVFNVLGPLTNPGRPTAGLIGCADARLAPVMAQVFADRGDRVLVVRGDDGWDEITPQTSTRVWDTTAGDGAVEHSVITPADVGLADVHAEELRGGDARHNAEVALGVFGLPRQHPEIALHANVAAVQAVTIANAAAALYAYACALGHDRSPSAVAGIQDHLLVARTALESGAAGELLRRWIDRANALAGSS